MRGEAVPKHMRRGVFSNVGLACRLADCLLHHGFVQVKPVTDTCVPIGVMRGGGKDPLPAPLAIRVGILASQCRGQRRAAQTASQIPVGSKNSSEHFDRWNQVLRHQTRSSRISKMSSMWTSATNKSQLCKPRTFQNRVRIPCFQTLRTQRTISRRVRHGELCSRERYRPLESDMLEAEVYRLGFCRFIRPVYLLCFTVFKKPANS